MSGKRLDPRFIAGIVFLLAGVVLAAAVRPGPGIVLGIVGGSLMAAGIRAACTAAPPADGMGAAPAERGHNLE